MEGFKGEKGNWKIIKTEFPNAGGEKTEVISFTDEGLEGRKICNVVTRDYDISEAYLHDVSSPLKKHLPDYKAIEHRMNLVLAKKFGFQYPFPAAVKKIDRRVLEWEWKEIMLTQQPQLEYFSFQKWKNRFLDEYQNLRK